LPAAILLSIWSYQASVLKICIEFSIATALSVYIIITAALSPCPPLVDSWFGSLLIITAWVLCQCIYMRVRCLVAARLERYGHSLLLALGFMTMMGQVIGGIIVYIIVNEYKLLKDKPACVFDYSYCKA
jgi:hypothetical protein